MEEKLKTRSDISISTDDIFAELAVRKRHRSNVIAVNVIESMKMGGQERLEEDKSKFLAVIRPNIVSNITNLKLRRLGRPTLSPDVALYVRTRRSLVHPKVQANRRYFQISNIF